MKILLNLSLIFALTLTMGCGSSSNKSNESKQEEIVEESSPKEMLKQAYQLFKEGDDAGSIKLANAVLAKGRDTKNDTLIGKALTSLCRNAQRSLDTTRLTELSTELAELSNRSGDKQWMMYRAHMNAEMWRLVGNMDRAEMFYNESMKISLEIGSKGMYTIDHFNKSFVSTAKGDFESANNLIKKYYELRREANQKSEDAYGLIALAYLLEQKEDFKGAHEVATVTRRLFKEQNLFPEPPDEKPLLLVEEKVKQELEPRVHKEIGTASTHATVTTLLEKYIE